MKSRLLNLAVMVLLLAPLGGAQETDPLTELEKSLAEIAPAEDQPKQIDNLVAEAEGAISEEEESDKSVRFLPIERSVYLPYEELEKVFEEEGRGVFLPYREFLDLWNELTLERAKREEEKPPKDGVLASAHYQAEVVGEALRIKARLTVESFQKDWAVLPLLEGTTLGVAEASMGEATLNHDGKRYEIILPKAGEYPIELTMYAPIHREGGKSTVKVHLPKTAVSRFELEVPEQGWEFELSEGTAFTTADLAEGATELQFFVGKTGALDVSWLKEADDTGLEPLLFAQVNLRTSASAGAIATRADLNYRVLRSGVDTLEVRIPKGHELLAVQGANIREWDLEPEGEDQKLTVSLHAKAESNYGLSLELEAPLEALPAVSTVPSIEALGVRRQLGTLSLAASTDLEVTTEDLEGLVRQTAATVPVPGDQAGLHELGSYRYLRYPYAAGLALKEAEPLVEVTTLNTVDVDLDLVTFDTRLDYLVKRVGIFGVRVEVPEGYEGLEAVDGPVDDFVEIEEDGRRFLDVAFTGRCLDAFSFRVKGRRTRGEVEEGLSVPVVFPVDVARHEGRTGLKIHTSLEPKTDSLGGFRQEDVRRLFGEIQAPPAPNAANQQVQTQTLVVAPDAAGSPSDYSLAFRVRGAEAEAPVLSFKEKEPQVDADVLTRIEIREQVTRYRWQVALKIRYAGIDEFLVEIPNEIAADLRVDDPAVKEIHRDWTPEELADADAADAAADADAKLDGPPEGRQWWRIVFRDRRMEPYSVDFNLEVPVTELESGEKTRIELPELKVIDVFRETGQIAVVKEGSLEIFETDPQNLELIDPLELRDQLREDGVFLAYKYKRHPIVLGLVVAKNKFLEVPEAVITYADITTAVSSDKGRMTEVVYWVRNNSLQFLSLDLPPNGRIESDIYVDGQPQQPRRRPDSDQILIRLPSGGDRTESFPVRFVYAVPSADPGSSMGFRSTLDLESATVDVEILESQLHLFLPHDYLYTRFAGPMHQRLPDRGWSSFRRAFDWLVPTLGPGIDHGSGTTWSAPPSLPAAQSKGFDLQVPREGRSFLLHRLDAPAPMTVSVRSRGLWFLLEGLAFLAALLGGLLLTRVSLRLKLIYFVVVGLGAAVLAGVVHPEGAGLWRAICFGAILAAFWWLIWGWIRWFHRAGIFTSDRWAARRRAKALAAGAVDTSPVDPVIKDDE